MNFTVVKNCFMLNIYLNKTERKTWQVLSFFPENYTNICRKIQVESFLRISATSWPIPFS